MGDAWLRLGDALFTVYCGLDGGLLTTGVDLEGREVMHGVPGGERSACNSRTTLSTDEVHDALAQPRAPFSASAFPLSFQPSGCPPEIDSLNVVNLPSVAKRKAAACRSGRIAVFEGANRIRLSSHAGHLSWPPLPVVFHCCVCLFSLCGPHLKANHQHLELCLNHQYLRIGRNRQHLSHS